ncbi:MAG: MFS transporter, partial [Chloroflexota bacterium]|nr:MFS transporter [Chloroflexota bacterium]
AALNLVFVVAFLPEPNRAPVPVAERRRPSQVALLAQALGGPLAFFFVMAFLVSFAMGNLESTFALYSQAQLGFTATDMGIAFTFMGLAGAIMQGALVGKAIDRYGEERLIQFGLIATAAGFLLILAAFDRVSMIIFITAQSVGSAFLRPAISSLLSKRTTSGQGATLGMQYSFDSLGRIVGPAWGGFIFESHHTYPYLTGAGVFLAAWVASLLKLGRTPGQPADDVTG